MPDNQKPGSDETTWRAISSAGLLVVAICHAGEEKVKEAVLASLQPYWTNRGGYRQRTATVSPGPEPRVRSRPIPLHGERASVPLDS